MKKISILLMLLIGIAMPWAANAQETKVIKGVAVDSQIVGEKGGDRGTMTVYKHVTSLTSGKNYLIVNSQTADSDALALSQTSSNTSNITASYVHINSGISATNNAVYIAEVADPTAVWTATSSSSAWTFSHSNNGSTYSIYTNRSTLSASTSSTNWTFSSNSLYYHYEISIFGFVISSTDYYITPDASGFSLGTSSANVYLYEETSVTAYNVIAEVSPAGIGRVTGAGQYPAGATCTLTASTNNSEYVFSNWTVNGTVVSTDPTYTFTVSADQNVVANFESTVTCPAPSNLTATPYSHSVSLSWAGEADNFNVQYRTIGSGETQTFFDGFENGLGNWTVIRNGGGTDATDWLQGPDRDNLSAHTGSYVAESRSWNSSAYSVDNWLITPQVTLDGILRFWAYGNGSFPDHYDVYVSTTGNSISDFSLLYEPASVTSTWTEVTVDLSSFNGVSGYIALRHTDTDKEYLMIDDFGIYTQSYDEWSQLIPVSENQITLTGLDSQTAYQAQVQANCGGGDLSDWSNRVNFTTTAPSTATPTNLTVEVNSITINSATVSWQGVDANDYHEYYEVYYAESSVTSVPSSPVAPNFISNITTTTYSLTGLNPDTEYHVWVRDYCGEDGYSNWSDAISFTTIYECLAPYDLSFTDITTNQATLGWEGIQESYNVQYRNIITAAIDAGDTYNFNDGTQGWTTIDADGHGDAWSYQSSGGNSGGCMRAKWNTSYDHQDYLVSPQITLGGSISFYAKKGGSYTDTFRVYLSTSGNTNASDFTIELTNGNVTPTTSYAQYTYDLSNYSGMGYVAIVYTALKDQYYLYVDDINISVHIPAAYGSWVTETNVTSPLEVIGLMPSTNYEWQVQGVDCDGNGSATEWSEAATFSTLPLPSYTKTIAAYQGDGGYYLIASPLAEAVSPTTVGMITDEFGVAVDETTSTYDLYRFDQNQDREWINYRANTFDLVNGQGYLYASKGGTTLTFIGLPNSGDEIEVSLNKTSGAEFEGCNLVGNPFAVEAYIVDGHDFYRLEEGGAEIMTEASTGAINPMEGVFVFAQSDNESITFTTTAPAGKTANLALNLTKDRNIIDRAIIRFGEGRMLPKFQLKKSSTKVYMPIDNKDYAVVYSEEMGEMPVSFKAENNGSYTLSFTAEEVSFAYLHLIDNKTGVETNLLANPNYSFEAKTTDYENRFKLVFVTGNNANDDAFAFYSTGSFVINNEGEATLQVIDINGRILKSESINGCANVNVNAAQGIYMLRLVNGDSVKVQKVVVK